MNKALTSRTQAQDLLLAQAVPQLPVVSVGLDAALGRVLAEDLHSRIDLPPFSASAMDGYAYRWRPGEQCLRVAARIPAGAAAPPLPAEDACARIFTGAMLPAGADSVVIQEDVHIDSDGRVCFTSPERAALHVRPQAGELARGDLILAAGTRLRADRIALAATCGHGELPVRARLKIALIASGDELLPAGSELVPGKIYNSNAPMLAAWMRAMGWEVDTLPVLADNAAATEQLIADCAAAYNAVVLSGGVSLGEEDHVRGALEKLGSVIVAGVAIKPGKPFICARVDDCFVFGLPGNPVSALVTLEILARPLLLHLSGQGGDLRAQEFRVTSAVDIAAEGRERYMRATIDADNRAHPHPLQLSANLSGSAHSAGYLRVPAGEDIKAGSELYFTPYCQLRC